MVTELLGRRGSEPVVAGQHPGAAVRGVMHLGLGRQSDPDVPLAQRLVGPERRVISEPGV